MEAAAKFWYKKARKRLTGRGGLPVEDVLIIHRWIMRCLDRDARCHWYASPDPLLGVIMTTQQLHPEAQAGMFDAVLHRLRHLYLCGRPDECAAPYAAIRRLAGMNSQLLASLHQLRISELRVMSRALQAGKTYHVQNPVEGISEQFEPAKRDDNEAAVVKRAVEDVPALLTVCGAGNWPGNVTFDVEHAVRGGRVDLVVWCGRRVVLFEFKRRRASHSVVGQIAKYRLHFESLISNHLWDEVYGVVVADSFDETTQAALKRDGVLLVQHTAGPVDEWRALNLSGWSPSLIAGLDK